MVATGVTIAVAVGVGLVVVFLARAACIRREPPKSTEGILRCQGGWLRRYLT